MSQSKNAAFPFERFFETSKDLLFIIDPNARFQRINLAFHDVLGYPEETLKQRSLFEILHPEDIETASARFAPLVKERGTLRLETRVIHRDRSDRKLAITLRAFPGDSMVYGVGRDITPHTGTDERARRSALLLQKTQATAHVGGWEFDCRTNELFWTDETYRIHEVPLDYSPNVETAINFYAPEAIPLITTAFGGCIERGEPYDLELQLITAKGRRIWVRAAGSAVWEDGKVVRVYGSFQDIDETKLRELELAEKLAIIEQQQNEIQAMSAPIIQVWNDVLALPIVGKLDAVRAEDMTQRLLDAVVQSRSSYVILDLTGVEAVDEATADHLVRIIRAIQLLGARSIVTGIRPAVAQIFVSLGADLADTMTLSNLRDAIKVCMRPSVHQRS